MAASGRVGTRPRAWLLPLDSGQYHQSSACRGGGRISLYPARTGRTCEYLLTAAHAWAGQRQGIDRAPDGWRPAEEVPGARGSGRQKGGPGHRGTPPGQGAPSLTPPGLALRYKGQVPARHQKVVDLCNWWLSSVLVWLSLTSLQIDLRLTERGPYTALLCQHLPAKGQFSGHAPSHFLWQRAVMAKGQASAVDILELAKQKRRKEKESSLAAFVQIPTEYMCPTKPCESSAGMILYMKQVAIRMTNAAVVLSGLQCHVEPGDCHAALFVCERRLEFP
ncbi:hypothetical protein HDV62DRAFT_378875 [Trichoderma sp. SZMC 28011]